MVWFKKRRNLDTQFDPLYIANFNTLVNQIAKCCNKEEPLLFIKDK